jgi:hypothetical protein
MGRIKNLNKQERSAMEAVAKHFSATWEQGSDTSDVYISVAGNRAAVDITTIDRRGTSQRDDAKPRLRFDKVATGLIQHLQAALAETVPDGMTVLLTITAPIRLPSKTACSLEDKIQTLLRQGSSSLDEKDTIHGNRVRIRLLKDESEQAPKLIGFVHNSDSDPVLLFNMTRDLLELVNDEIDKRSPRLAGDRWLVVISGRTISCLGTYRYIYSQLRMPIDYVKILMVFGDGRIGLVSA